MTAESDPNRQAGGKFGPGNVANPGGRPALPDWFKSRAPEALKYLLEVACGDVEAEPKIRIKAAEIVVDRAYGKAQQAVEVTGDGPGQALTALLALAGAGKKE